ncbi:MAG: NAD(P)H-binding protein, partial [Myxococcota bacterium]|nr:NAD(P)H-binding protein [Myxococcota bacterium]
MDEPKKLTVVVAGATGFVGQTLPRVLADRFRLIGLSRSATKSLKGYEAMRRVDLFSLSGTRRALKGADIAIYLVHSMMPSARLVQGHFGDLDLMCADNFAKAAKDAKVKRILYVGGLVPEVDEDQLSAHLASRLEVERALSGTGVPI